MTVQRHCATCLKLVESPASCGKCSRRAYCSRKCKKQDWNQIQGHKHWCGVPYGEEDMDWELMNLDGPRSGIKAKRPFKKFERIMVLGIREPNDSAMEIWG